MAEAASDVNFIQRITSTLDSILVPYEWRMPIKYAARIPFESRRDEFGCLRRLYWPLRRKNRKIWNLIYEDKGGSRHAIWFCYEIQSCRFVVSGSELENPLQDFITQDSGEAFEKLERRIEEIPLEQ